MTKIIIDRNKRCIDKSTKDLEIGGAGVVLDNIDYINTIILRTFSGFISLNDPKHTWEVDPGFTILPIKELIISYIL